MKILTVEEQVMRGAIAALIDAGFLLMVNDGEENVTPRTTDQAVIFDAMRSTGEDYIIVWDRDLKKHGWVWFVYGNDGWEVICDYTTNLDPALADVFKAIDEYQDGL